MSRGKPEPTIVSMSPPRALATFGVTEVITNAILMSATPEANGIRPLESLISALWSPALGAFLSVQVISVAVYAALGVESAQVAPPKLRVTPVVGREVPVTTITFVL